MRLKFTKMHGLGNDFIVLDLRKQDVRNLPKLMKKLSDRRFGIGFDQ
ncbi:MAG TPA: diaminopimelate epimerase, partial [Thermodesulfobacteriota bacterium]|nr:diaminopimelate epimerase [Thermodesulfobacteriota bacterium]